MGPFKMSFGSAKINNVEIEVIDENRVDKEVFYSDSHGLDADFIKLFEF